MKVGDRVKVMKAKACGCANDIGLQLIVTHMSEKRNGRNPTCGLCDKPYRVPDGSRYVTCKELSGRVRYFYGYRLSSARDLRVLLCK